MPYRSRHSGQQIDNAIDEVNAAINNMGMWYNRVVQIEESDWKNNNMIASVNARYVYTSTYNFNPMNQFPMVYFIGHSDGMIYDIEALY
jgi:hypothetical protein